MVAYLRQHWRAALYVVGPIVLVMIVRKPLRAALATLWSLAFVTGSASADEPGHLLVGVTHGQYSADSWGNADAVGRARSMLETSFPIQNQHIMGWGALNPEPSPGVFRFATLDKRVSIMRATGARMVITLCCAPDWMKGGQPGETRWARLEEAPLPEHYDDFADLAATIARRYPDVKDFMVWNELKGFNDSAQNRWDIEAYTEMYNEVYDALKAVDPSIRVGGPYVPMNSWSTADVMSHPSDVGGDWGVVDQRALDVVEHWLEHAHGADFLVVDGGIGNRNGTTSPSPADAAKFSAVNEWLHSVSSLPIWWAEVHLGQVADSSDFLTSELLIETLRQQARSGASVVLLWQPQGTARRCRLCMWTDTETASGGQATRAYRSIAPALASQPISVSDLDGLRPAPLVESEEEPLVIGAAEVGRGAVRVSPP